MLEAIPPDQEQIGDEAEGLWVTCKESSANRCSICGAVFGDSAFDVVCANGHQLGWKYFVFNHNR